MKNIITFSLLLCTAVAFSQEKEKDKKADNNLPLGNEQFSDKEYASAEANYRISHSNAPEKAAAAYNLGNAIYKQKQPSEAKYAYVNAIKAAKDKKQKHMAYHNMGNVLMSEKNYEGAVDAYKNALRNNPQDEETRYNYALAKSMLKNNPPPPKPKSPPPPPKPDPKSQPKPNQGGGQGDDKQKDKGDQGKNQNPQDKGDQKDKNKDQGKDKDNNQDPGQNKDKGEGKDKQNKNGGDPQPTGTSPDKERMKNMLDAMNNEEKKVQEKLNAKKVKAQPKKQDKDW
jgi:tetratricopeptide (TPR) repeat protein